MIITEEDGTVDTGFKGTQQPIVQNLGPGDIHINTTGVDIATTGLYLPEGGVYEFPATLVEGGGNLFIAVLAGHESADVRIVNVG
jgi:hypothetical protein